MQHRGGRGLTWVMCRVDVIERREIGDRRVIRQRLG